MDDKIIDWEKRTYSTIIQYIGYHMVTLRE